MKAIDFIKQDREISLNHWRYRLLHFVFNGRENLPKFMYTHYCPLFHVTNLCALLLPFIVLFKIGFYFSSIISGYIKLTSDYFKARDDTYARFYNYIGNNEGISVSLNRCLNIISEGHHSNQYMPFSYGNNAGSISSLSYETIAYIWLKALKAVKKNADKKSEVKVVKERRLEEKKKRDLSPMLVTWISIGQGITKILMWVLYIFLAYVLVKLSALGIVTVWPWLVSLFTIETYIAIGQWVGGIGLGIVSLCGVWMLTKYLLVNNKEQADKIKKTLSSSLLVGYSILSGTWQYSKGSYVAVNDFVCSLYSNNCPKITITEDQDKEEEE